MFQSNVIGFSYFNNQNRKYKRLAEKFWQGLINETELRKGFSEIREENWLLQKKEQVDLISSNDFSPYDRMLDHVCLLGCLPERFKKLQKKLNLSELEVYYAMARGESSEQVNAMELTKWFDTNYHYIVPELSKEQTFQIGSNKIFEEFAEAKALGINTKPSLIGPVTFLMLSKESEGSKDFSCLELLDRLTEVYAQILNKLSEQGAELIQLEEPCLVLDLDEAQKSAYRNFQELLQKKLDPNFKAKIILTTYFEEISPENFELICKKESSKNLWEILHIDLVSSENSSEYLKRISEGVSAVGKKLSLGVINGRNIWINDLKKTIALIEQSQLEPEQLILGTSCSLLHVPLDLETENKLEPELKSWMAFAKQKLEELRLLQGSLRKNLGDAEQALLEKNTEAISKRKKSSLIYREQVESRGKKVTPANRKRETDFKSRQKLQKELFALPIFPTTTIGSFPQTPEVRQFRSKYKKGEISEQAYDQFLRAEIEKVISYQEKIGMDVLVHGEFERNDMVEYFGQYLTGFTTSENGWVQSYGTRGVKPPVIYGDIERISDMSVKYTEYAQSLTRKKVKGMLTGPVTILQWSFVRDDQPRSQTADQIALAILDEVQALEKAGIKIIQIDEPAYREGLPLKREKRAKYLKWATEAFRLSSSQVADSTQIHTHMCYSEFNDIIEQIAEMDADVITIETSRSDMELLEAFVDFKYPNEIGPGIYDVHSKNVPPVERIKSLIEKSCEFLPKENIWVNPDCGLKTRGWEETKSSLENMVAAAVQLRAGS